MIISNNRKGCIKSTKRKIMQRLTTESITKSRVRSRYWKKNTSCNLLRKETKLQEPLLSWRSVRGCSYLLRHAYFCDYDNTDYILTSLMLRGHYL